MAEAKTEVEIVEQCTKIRKVYIQKKIFGGIISYRKLAYADNLGDKIIVQTTGVISEVIVNGVKFKKVI